MALDDLLYLCGCETQPFDEDGELTPDGEIAYQKLNDIVYEFEDIGVIFNANHIMSQLDEIVSSDGLAY